MSQAFKFFALAGMLAGAIHAATRYEAEDATGTTTLTATSVTASGGSYVKMQGGNLSFTVQAATAATYDLVVHYAQGYDANGKVQNLVVNGSTVGSLSFPYSIAFTDMKSVVKLSSGSNTLAITNSWGWVDVDYIEISAHTATPFTLTAAMATPGASASAQKVFTFLQSKFQKKVVSGVMTLDLLNGMTALDLHSQAEVSYIKGASGKEPALVGFDFMHATGKNSDGSWYKAYSNATVTMATQLWKEGGIPQFTWHWKDPLKNVETFYVGTASTTVTTFNFAKAFKDSTTCATWDSSSAEFKAMLGDIDTVAAYLKKLQTTGVPVLWRPVHESSGGWFWWGAHGPTAFKALYNLVFSRLTSTHGLNNLIWVWNSDGKDAAWYPGESKVDIIGRDYYYYPRITNHASLLSEFETLKGAFGTNKLITLAENGSIPYPDSLVADAAGWSYFMPWYGDYVTGADNGTASWNTIMNHDYVITLDKMPGWSNVTTGIAATAKAPSVSTVRVRNGSLELVNTITGEISVELVALDGKRIATLHQGNLDAGTHAYSVKAAKGMYLVRVRDASGISTARIALP